MGLFTNATCLRELDSTRWSVNSFPSQITIMIVIMNPNTSRRKSTKQVSLAHVHVCTAWAATLSHVGGQTFQDWKPLNYFVRIAMTSMSPQAAVSRALTVCHTPHLIKCLVP